MPTQINPEKPNWGVLRILEDEIKKQNISTENITILDIGCGKGTNSIELAKQFHVDLIGVDCEKDVLMQAKNAYSAGNWVLLDADTLHVKKTSVDIVLLSFVLHLLKNPKDLLKTILRGLKIPNGLLFIVTVDHDQITSGIFAKYFPEAVLLDLKRFPKVVELQQLLAELGYETWIRTQRYFQRITDQLSVKIWVERAHNRIFSCFNLYSQEELNHKLRRMEEDLTQQIQKKKHNLRRKTTIIGARRISKPEP